MNISPLSIKNTAFYRFLNQKNKYSSSPRFKGRLNQDVIEIEGSQTKAKVFAKDPDENLTEQIKTICSHPVFKDLPVRIMPDTHKCRASLVGFTSPIGIKGEIIPGIIGGDIGCGMLCCEIDTNGQDIDYKKLDYIINNKIVPTYNRMSEDKKSHLSKIANSLKQISPRLLNTSEKKMISDLGTLGGGNHFIELDKSQDGRLFLVIHSGSRGFGQAVYNYHNNVANKQNPYTIKALSYLTGDEAQQYLEDMRLAQNYARLNRRIMADSILKAMNWNEKSSFESVHNYISDDNIIRKGAISAHKNEKVIIPLNMKDGALIAKGKGNPDWNNSAPHGAGRKISRARAKELIKLEAYQHDMQGIYTTSVCEKTIDEAPGAYKNSDEIKETIIPAVDIVEQIKPQYNYKKGN